MLKKFNRVLLGRCVLFVGLYPFAAGYNFTSRYGGRNITAGVGSSVNFSWSIGAVQELSFIKFGFIPTSDTTSIEGGNELVVISLATGVPTVNNRRASVSWNKNITPGEVTFTLSPIQAQDSRTFGCQIKPRRFALTSLIDIVNLVVFEKPKIIYPSVRKSYKEGLPVIIACTSRGIPAPNVKWLRNGAVLSSASKTASLTFVNISRKDDGNYTCQSCNNGGCDYFHFSLVINYKPEGVTLTTSAAQNIVMQGDKVTLTCHVTAAKPQVSGYRFYFNNSLVSNSSNRKHTINNVQRSQHYGEYRCLPYNDAGNGPEATVTLNINVPVQFKEVPQNITVNTSTPIFLTCDASGFPTPYVRWTKSGKTLSDKKQLHISSSNKGDAGEYMCTVSNGVRQEKSARAYVTVQYPPNIQIITASSLMSWISQTVTLQCQSDGVPTPTLTWYKPDGDEIKRETNKEIKAKVALNDSVDFGDYKCVAENGLTPPDEKRVKINQIKKPGQASIISTKADVQANSLTVRWTAPTDDGGSPITAYRIIILKGDTKKGSVNITGLSITNHTFTGLERDTNYTTKVFARNSVFEGDAAEKTLKTNGPPKVVKIDELPIETKDDTITLRWKEPGNNGKVISLYTAYQRTVTDGKVGDWKELQKITDVKDRQLEIRLKKGEVYEFAITATNALGEGLKQDASEIKRVKAVGIPAAVEIYGLPSKATEDTITLRWIEPKDNGKIITHYSVYQRTLVNGRPGKWKMIKEISDVKVREFKVKLERRKVYQFVVTATNGVGESLKPDEKKIPRIKTLGSSGSSKDSPIGGESGKNTAIYSGAAVAGVLLIIEIIVIIVLWRRRRPSSPNNGAFGRQRTQQDERSVHENEMELRDLQSGQPDPMKLTQHPAEYMDLREARRDKITAPSAAEVADYAPLHPLTRSWEVPRDHVTVQKIIGKGAFGQVAKGIAVELRGKPETTTVAIKMLKFNAAESDKRDLMKELETMKQLKPHPHVIKLLGCVTESEPLLVLIEYVPFGDLLGYLRKSRGLNDNYYKDPDIEPKTNLTSQQLMKFAWQIADGMSYLSSKSVSRKTNRSTLT